MVRNCFKLSSDFCFQFSAQIVAFHIGLLPLNRRIFYSNKHTNFNCVVISKVTIIVLNFKFQNFVCAFALIAVASADVSHLLNNNYLPPVAPSASFDFAVSSPTKDYLPPVQHHEHHHQAPGKRKIHNPFALLTNNHVR